jgi:type II secretory pathway pseudopilin PulG
MVIPSIGAKRKVWAFTLSEAVISLGLLGVIAALALPKVLEVSQNAKRIAQFKEGVSIAESMTKVYFASDRSQTFRDYFISRARVKKVCNTNGIAQGCATAGFNYNRPTLILQNGSAITLGDAVTSEGIEISIDWDGPDQGANVAGDDILSMLANTTTLDVRQHLTAGDKAGSIVRGGEVATYYDLNAVATTPMDALYKEVFGRANNGSGSGALDTAQTVNVGSGGASTNTDDYAVQNNSTL